MIEVAGTFRRVRPGFEEAGSLDDGPRRVVIKIRPREEPFATADALGSATLSERRDIAPPAFGASDADIAAAASFLERKGFQVIVASAPQRMIVATAPPRIAAEAFGVELKTYANPDTTESYAGFEGSLFVPDDLRAVTAVAGLDSRVVAQRPRGLKPLALPTQPYSVDTLMRAYRFPTDVYGAGQRIACLQFGEKYSPPDAMRYFTDLCLGVDVQPLPVGEYPNTGRPMEPMLDVEIAGASAPAANVRAHLAAPTEAGWLESVTAVTSGEGMRPTVISISYGWPEDGDAQDSGLTRAVMCEVNRMFAEAACRGITVIVATGDWGAFSGNANEQDTQVVFPASSPYVLACGGTSVEFKAGSIACESVWNSTELSLSSGGGASHVFPRPSWQKITVPDLAGAGTGRAVPDVAAYADDAVGVLTFVDGAYCSAYGTSAATPLWAGLIARINDALARRQPGASVGYFTPRLYGGLGQSPAINDVVQGSNGGYDAAPGWDACTGWGSPNGVELMNALLQP